MPKLFWLSLLLAIAGFAATPGKGADEPDLIFKRSTVFKLLTPNDKLATYGLDDPEVEGVACHFTVPERGGLGASAGDRPAGGRVTDSICIVGGSQSGRQARSKAIVEGEMKCAKNTEVARYSARS
jgi:catabolite regulation protein CreA